MRKDAACLMAIDFSTVGVTRFLVVSYFIGVGLGLVEGVDIAVLTYAFVPDPVAKWLASLLFLGLSFLILVGFWRRLAALLLALAVFWASYLTMVIQSGPDQIGSFWRDLALIGALLLTYRQNEPDLRKSRQDSRVPKGDRPEPSDTKSQTQDVRRITTGKPRPKRVRTEIYRQDLETIRHT